MRNEDLPAMPISDEEQRLFNAAKNCFDDIIDADDLQEMKRSKIIRCGDGFRLSGIALIQQAIEDALLAQLAKPTGVNEGE